MKKIKGQLKLNGISDDGKPYVPSAPLKEWLGDHPQTQESLGAWLGVSGSVVGTWIRDGRMPVYIGLVIALSRSVNELEKAETRNKFSPDNPFVSKTIEALEREVKRLEGKLEQQEGRQLAPQLVVFNPKNKQQIEYLVRTADVMNLNCSVMNPTP